MKKIIFVVATVFSFAVLFTACKETKKEEVKEEMQMESHEGHDHDAMNATAYQCPMDCEKGKTYDAEGTCPVCKMDLKETTGMEHAEGCKCMEAGECTCPDGKCTCKDEIACAKCEPGNCTCKNEVAKAVNTSSNCGPGKCSCNA
ncbi:heavy metal-binding domain-containing protein [Lutibacter sp.]|uniref:heavy metal-binding domain-containing protein n=1 Tax=Lutibacter sp. TaxID=1925666 RepID=UPI00356311FF